MSFIEVTWETLSNTEGSFSEDKKSCLAFWDASERRVFIDAMMLFRRRARYFGALFLLIARSSSPCRSSAGSFAEAGECGSVCEARLRGYHYGHRVPSYRTPSYRSLDINA